jgi:hypothetical protein
MDIAHDRMRHAEALCSAQGATLAVVRAYRDAYKAFEFLSKRSATAAALATIAAARAHAAREML